MEESTSPHPSGSPCHLYKHFLDQPSASCSSATPSPASSEKIPPRRSMLVTGFGLRSWDSLQRALLDDEQRRQMLLDRHDKGEAFECDSLSSESSKMFTLKSRSKSTVFSQHSDIISMKTFSLQYLMGLGDDGEAVEEAPGAAGVKAPSIEGEVEEEVDPRMTLAMRKARKYLRQHKIFEFFQFLIAHMLSALPENPIEFLIELLDKCLLYRSGFGNPPLLFEKSHIEQLFNMMDRMRTGFVEFEQYETGMKTLGICSYDKKPPLSTEGDVPKDFFIEEACDCLTDLFVAMVRRHGPDTPLSLMTPPPTEVNTALSCISSNGQ